MPVTPRRRDTGLRKKFGISQLQYESLSQEQNHVCFICRDVDDFSDVLAVDHCHKNGHVRGLLCRNCNRALGQFQDNVEFLERAVVYLKRSPPNLGPPEPPAPPKPHAERARWFCTVSTPKGQFNSLKEAGKAYQVHPTTVREWCVGTKCNKPEFTMTKEFRT